MYAEMAQRARRHPNHLFRNVKDSSVIAVQIFDQRKFKRRDQGFLGVVNIPVRDHLDMDVGGQGAQQNPL